MLVLEGPSSASKKKPKDRTVVFEKERESSCNFCSEATEDSQLCDDQLQSHKILLVQKIKEKGVIIVALFLAPFFCQLFFTCPSLLYRIRHK